MDTWGHEETANGTLICPGWDTTLTSFDVMVKPKARRGVSTGLPGAERPENQARCAKADLTPFCDFRGLWHTSAYKLPAPPGW
jgi:hypothetical protein